MTQQFSAIVMLQVQARVVLDRHDEIRMRAQTAVSAVYDNDAPITGMHFAGQRLRSASISLSMPDELDDPQLRELVRAPACACANGACRRTCCMPSKG